MDDIEDAAKEIDTNTERLDRSNLVQSKPINKGQGKPGKVTKTVGIESPASNSDKENDDKQKDNNLPGHQRVWVKTYGCSHNISDSEYMEGLLAQYGYEISNNQEDADVWLINSCTVKDPSQAAFMHLVNQAKTIEKPVVVAGCVSQADRNLNGLEDVSVVGITNIDRVVEVVEQTLQGNTVKLLTATSRAKNADGTSSSSTSSSSSSTNKKLKEDFLPKLDLPKIRKNPLIEIIPISTGCLGSCTYCKTKQARGKLGSYSIETIVRRVQSVIKEGVSEIWLSSEDTGAYGRDIDTNIVELLKAIIAVLPPQGGVMLRIGMTNPPYILEHLDAIAEILNHPLVYAFLHVPVQAGSNKVLDAMNREYTAEEFRQVADVLLSKVPNITIATDIICGFPNESEEDFQQTYSLIEHYRFAITNISQFYPRPGTPAARMKRIATQIVKDRSRRLTKLFESFTPYISYIGQILPVWFDIETSTDHSNPMLIQSVGHTKAYVKVLVPYQDQLPGSCYEVEIIKADRFHIEGRIKRMIYPPNMHLQKTPVLASGGSSNHSSGSANGRSKTAVTLATIEEDYGDHQAATSSSPSSDGKKLSRTSGDGSNMRSYMLMTGVALIFWLVAQRGSRVHS